MGHRYQNIRCHTLEPGLLLKLPAQEQPEKVDVFLLLIGAGKTGAPSLLSCCCRPKRNAVSRAELGSRQALSTLSFSDGLMEDENKATCVQCLFSVILLYNVVEANVFYDET